MNPRQILKKSPASRTIGRVKLLRARNRLPIGYCDVIEPTCRW